MQNRQHQKEVFFLGCYARRGIHAESPPCNRYLYHIMSADTPKDIGMHAKPVSFLLLKQM